MHWKNPWCKGEIPDGEVLGSSPSHGMFPFDFLFLLSSRGRAMVRHVSVLDFVACARCKTSAFQSAQWSGMWQCAPLVCDSTRGVSCVEGHVHCNMFFKSSKMFT